MNNIPADLYAKIHESMPIICVDCVVSCDNKILLVKRKLEPMKGSWWFPGGRLHRDEKLEVAVRRVVKGETSLSIRKPTLLGFDETEFDADPFNHGNGTHTVNFVYASNASEMEMMRIVLDVDHIAHSMFTFEEIYTSGMHPYVKRFTAIAEGVLRK